MGGKFLSGSDRKQVSVGGGTPPAWGAGSAEIFYISKTKQLMTTAFKTGEVGTPQALYRIEHLVEFGDRIIYPASNTYVAAANGQRFLVAVRAQDPNAPPIGIVQNWRALLKK